MLLLLIFGSVIVSGFDEGTEVKTVWICFELARDY